MFLNVSLVWLLETYIKKIHTLFLCNFILISVNCPAVSGVLHVFYYISAGDLMDTFEKVLNCYFTFLCHFLQEEQM